MAYNQNLVQAEEVVFTSTSLTLGFGSGQTVPPRYLVCEPTANMTVTLPLSTAQLPTSAANQYIPGAGPGYPITIFNNSAFTVTIAAATATSPAVSDTLTNVPTLSQQYSSVSLFSAPGENTWYGFERGASSTTATFDVTAQNVSSSSSSYTLFTADQPYIVTSVSGVWGTASATNGAFTVEKATGTVATGSGTALLTATVPTSTTANTVVNGTLVATTATLTFAAGNRLNIVLSGTLTSLANGCVTVGLRKLA